MNALPICWFSDLEKIDFKSAHALQLRLLGDRIDNVPGIDRFLFLEHPPVFTLGRGGGRTHLKVSPYFLSEAGIDIINVERGGDITYHGPGQLVLYPIFHLKKAGMGIRDFVDRLEEVMIRTSEDFGVRAFRDSRNRGIWCRGKKMGFIGIALRQGVSFHGLSLNVAPSLLPFSWMAPCGLKNIEVTSIARESGNAPSMDAVKAAMRRHLEGLFHITMQPAPFSLQ
jgi:lipoate-protein ligase B